MNDPGVAAALTVFVLGLAAAVGSSLWFIASTISFDHWRARRKRKRQAAIEAARCDIEQRKVRGDQS